MKQRSERKENIARVALGPAMARLLLILLLVAPPAKAENYADPPAFSLHPLYTEETLVGDEEFVGKWVDPDQDLWVVEEIYDKCYTMTYKPKGEEKECAFLDVRQRKDWDLTLPVHLFGRLWIERDEMRIALLVTRWLAKKLEEGQLDLGHENTEDGLVLTASSEELQDFAYLYAQDEEAFTKTVTFQRLLTEDRP